MYLSVSFATLQSCYITKMSLFSYIDGRWPTLAMMLRHHPYLVISDCAYLFHSSYWFTVMYFYTAASMPKWTRVKTSKAVWKLKLKVCATICYNVLLSVPKQVLTGLQVLNRINKVLLFTLNEVSPYLKCLWCLFIFFNNILVHVHLTLVFLQWCRPLYQQPFNTIFSGLLW